MDWIRKVFKGSEEEHSPRREIPIVEEERKEELREDPTDEVWAIVESANPFVYIAQSWYVDDIDMLQSVFIRFLDLMEDVKSQSKRFKDNEKYIPFGHSSTREIIYYVFLTRYRGRRAYVEVMDPSTPAKNIRAIYELFSNEEPDSSPTWTAFELFIFRLNPNSGDVPPRGTKFNLPIRSLDSLRRFESVLGLGRPETKYLIYDMINGYDVFYSSYKLKSDKEKDKRIKLLDLHLKDKRSTTIPKDLFFAEVIPVLKHADPDRSRVDELYALLKLNELYYTKDINYFDWDEHNRAISQLPPINWGNLFNDILSYGESW